MIAGAIRAATRDWVPDRARAAEERAAFREHLWASAWGGISVGIFLLADVILAKTLGAPGWQITLMATLGPAANVFSFYFAGQVEGRPKAGAFLLSGILGRLSMAVLIARQSSGILIALYFLYSVASALIITATNSVFQARYSDRQRPLRVGVSASVSALFAIGSAQAAGILLEHREGLFPWLFAVSGVTGMLSVYHIFRMERHSGEARGPAAWCRIGWRSLRGRLSPAPEDARRQSIVTSLKTAARTFRDNPEFVRFERDYMIYGFAFLSLLPVLPVYIVRDLSMNYSQLSASKGLYALVGQVALSPILGAALGRLRPLRFTGRVFLLLAVYPLCLLISTVSTMGVPLRIVWVYGAFLVYSVAMAGVNLSWTLGSMHFAGGRDASAFQGLHVAMTGIRGLLAPSLGYLIASSLGIAACFAFSTILFTLAGIMMLRHDRDERERWSAAGAEERGSP